MNVCSNKEKMSKEDDDFFLWFIFHSFQENFCTLVLSKCLIKLFLFVLPLSCCINFLKERRQEMV